jgi:hypothetical protein
VSFQDANLRDAVLDFDGIIDSDFRGADLRGAQLNGTFVGDFSASRFQNPNFEGMVLRAPIQFSRFDMIRYRLDDTSFQSLAMQVDQPVPFDPVLRYGSDVTIDFLFSTNLFAGTAFRNVDLRRPAATRALAQASDQPWQMDMGALRRTMNLSFSFGDATVILDNNVGRPCQWPRTSITNTEEYYGAWRAWLERGTPSHGVEWPPLTTMDQEFIGRRPDGENFSIADVIARPDLVPCHADGTGDTEGDGDCACNWR